MLQTPQFLTIGHVTRDLLPNGSFSVGGTVTFAALTASRLGLASALVTCADEQFLSLLPTYLPGIEIYARPCAQTTTFVNRYTDGFRMQYLHARADSLRPEDVPVPWSAAPIVLLAPLDQELASEIVKLFPRRAGVLVAATPQGWLRHWDTNGRIWPTPWKAAEQVLPALDALILSHHDLLPFANGNRVEADAILERWSQFVPLLVATDGRYGASLYRRGHAKCFPAYPANEVDPTGAGDVFAAAFLFHLSRHGDPERAVDFANCVASFSVEREGILGVPTMEMVMKRLRS
jgi:1D-myo-inositol 3-kinase